MIQTAGWWPRKSETTKECVTTHLPNQLTLKMDRAGASDLYRAIGAQGSWKPLECVQAPMSRRAVVVGIKAWVKPPPVQILVVVANIQTRTLKTEVEKGSM